MMDRFVPGFVMSILLAGFSVSACAASGAELRSPTQGVLCDAYFCADAKGISREDTEKYLGKDALKKLVSQGSFDTSEFTFASGIFCDVKEKLCRENRYFGADGKRSGAVSEKYTRLLFGQ